MGVYSKKRDLPGNAPKTIPNPLAVDFPLKCKYTHPRCMQQTHQVHVRGGEYLDSHPAPWRGGDFGDARASQTRGGGGGEHPQVAFPADSVDMQMAPRKHDALDPKDRTFNE